MGTLEWARRSHQVNGVSDLHSAMRGKLLVREDGVPFGDGG